jgi:hypothetical protein
LYAAPARAQTTGVEYVVILLDQTGSMATNVNGSTTTTFWDSAISAAQSWVNFDDAFGRPPRAYSIWTFFDIDCPGCGPGGQNGAKKVWPVADSDCRAVDNMVFQDSTGFCVLGTISKTATSAQISVSDDTPYTALNARLGDEGTTTIPGTATSNIRTAFRAVTGVGNTPLADSLCASLEALQLTASANSKVLLIETDAGENDSKSFCSSLISTTALPAGATTFDKSLTNQIGGMKGDWGLSEDVDHPSWQAKTIRRAVRLTGNNAPTSANDTVHGQAATGAAIASGEDLASGPTGYKLRVDAHFMICHHGDPSPCPNATAFAVAMPGINLPSLGIVSQVGTEPSGNLRAPAAALINVTQAMTAPLTAAPTAKTAALAVAAATPSPGIPLIDANEFLFFQALGHINSKSSFHAVVSDSAVVFGTTHRIPGDVDDSGCTDRADFSIIKQKDVYYQRAVRPLEIAIRADLNRDGWVTKADAQIVLDNWGRGCINNPGTKPKL